MPGITPIADVPDAPTIGAVSDSGDGTTATVAYTAAVTGGTVTTFTATSTPGSFTGTGSSPISVTGLTAGTAYTFKVKGTNSTATGPESSASSSLTLVSPSSYNSIATVTVGSATQYVTFSSIPATYKHLELRLYARSGRARDVNSGLLLTINSGTYLTYNSYTEAYNGGTPTNSSGAGSVNGTIIQIPGTSADANAFGIGILRFIDYTNTNKFKNVLAYDGDVTATGGAWTTDTGYWNTTSAISEIRFETTDSGGTNIQVGSVFALYGIAG